MQLNPFYPNDPIPPGLFVGRTKEVSTISRALFQTLNGRPESVLVVGTRGSGKTSLVQYASSLEEDSGLHGDALGGKVVSVLVRCGGMTSLPEFAAACMEEIKQHFQSHARIWEVARQFFEEVEIDAIYVKLKAKDPSANPTTDFPRVPKKIWSDKLAKQYGALQLLIDETDDLSSVPEFPGFIKNLVETIKERPVANIQLVVTVVDEKLRVLIANHASFSRVFHNVTLGPLSESELESVVQRCLEETKPTVTIDAQALRLLKIFTAGVPNYLHQFCHEAFDVDTDNALRIDDIIRGAHGTQSVRGAFDILWDKHFRQRYAEDMQGDYKRKILHTLSLFEAPTSNGDIKTMYREIFREEPSTNITVFLTNMVNDGALKRFGKSNPYLYQIAVLCLGFSCAFIPALTPKSTTESQTLC